MALSKERNCVLLRRKDSIGPQLRQYNGVKDVHIGAPAAPMSTLPRVGFGDDFRQERWLEASDQLHRFVDRIIQTTPAAVTPKLVSQFRPRPDVNCPS